MVSRSQFDRAIRGARRRDERIAVFAAMLAKDAGLDRSMIVTGGSGVTLRTHGRFTSKDIDIVGPRSAIAPVLKGWGFVEEEGEKHRRYWNRGDLQLSVDIIDRRDYVGLTEGIETISTPHGPARVAATEDLIVRRLVFWQRERKHQFMDQAVVLYLEDTESIDTDYLQFEVRRERVQKAYAEMLALAATQADPR
ncbi:MAG: hypothetical protein WA761_06045 [Thermoplasmata archaeon]